jgi:hypothetical protein
LIRDVISDFDSKDGEKDEESMLVVGRPGSIRGEA